MEGVSKERLVEESRTKMIYAIQTFGKFSLEAIQASQELDQLLNSIQGSPLDNVLKDRR
ncbi:aspartyl-phosphate phosphatase Spo0E family protein [Bacillus sp. SCS-153A]|uniref:aspartyl-phosphate phosphatase Spo0E family protein n=1 Tax=Rossellomorea sedimentorum TaxID=3115294 RepID=UPI0039068B6F